MNPNVLRARVKTLDLFAEIEADLRQVEVELEKTLTTADATLTEVATHLLKAGGKRIRPALVLLAARFPGFNARRAVPVAMAVELIHMATLVHDDVVDKATTRRGMPTVNAKWSNQVSVLTGDYLFAKAFSTLAATGHNRLVQIMADLVFEMSRGELSQKASYYNVDQTEEDYLQRIAQKTAYFIAESCRVGGLVSEASEAEIGALYHYGMGVGLSFQIADDLLDFTGTANQVGKPVCGDLRIGILTLPVIHCLRSAHGEELRGIVGTRSLGEEEVHRVKDLLEKAGSLQYARQRANEYLVRACAQLDKVPGLTTRQTLQTLAEFVINRQF